MARKRRDKRTDRRTIKRNPNRPRKVESVAAKIATANIPPEWLDFIRWHKRRFRFILKRETDNMAIGYPGRSKKVSTDHYIRPRRLERRKRGKQQLQAAE